MSQFLINKALFVATNLAGKMSQWSLKQSGWNRRPLSGLKQLVYCLAAVFYSWQCHHHPLLQMRKVSIYIFNVNYVTFTCVMETLT